MIRALAPLVTCLPDCVRKGRLTGINADRLYLHRFHIQATSVSAINTSVKIRLSLGNNLLFLGILMNEKVE